MTFRDVVLSLTIGLSLFVSAGLAEELGRIGPVIARGEVRREIESTPILERPYRPLHFYGNSVRRAYHRSTAQPHPTDAGRDAAVREGRR